MLTLAGSLPNEFICEIQAVCANNEPTNKQNAILLLDNARLSWDTTKSKSDLKAKLKPKLGLEQYLSGQFII